MGEIPVNLREEMQQAVSDVGQRHIDVLLGHGVPPAELASLGARQEPFGVALIKTNPEGIYWPSDTGSPRLIIPCYERGDIVDLVALLPAKPDQWWHRTGAAAILGADLLLTCVKDHALEVVSTPLDWLKAGGRAICVLDWGASFHELSPLRDWPELRVDSPRLAAAVRQALSRPAILPKITISSKEIYRDAA